MKNSKGSTQCHINDLFSEKELRFRVRIFTPEPSLYSQWVLPSIALCVKESNSTILYAPYSHSDSISDERVYLDIRYIHWAIKNGRFEYIVSQEGINQSGIWTASLLSFYILFNVNEYWHENVRAIHTSLLILVFNSVITEKAFTVVSCVLIYVVWPMNAPGISLQIFILHRCHISI